MPDRTRWREIYDEEYQLARDAGATKTEAQDFARMAADQGMQPLATFEIELRRDY